MTSLALPDILYQKTQPGIYQFDSVYISLPPCLFLKKGVQPVHRLLLGVLVALVNFDADKVAD